MKTLKELREELARVLAQQEELLNKAAEERRELSKEEQEKYDQLDKQFSALEQTIERVQKLEERKRELGRGTSEPVSIQTVREEDHDERGNYRGYREFDKAGLGEMFVDVVKFRQTQQMPEKLRRLQLANGATEAVGADGGFLVQSDHVEAMFNRIQDAGKLASRCRTIDTSTGSVSLNTVEETAKGNGHFFGGVQVFRRAEAAQVQASKPKFRQDEVKADALEAVYVATQELLEDAPALQTLVAPMFIDALAWKVDDEIIGGNGAGGQCLGILNSPATIVIPKETGQTAGTVNYDNVDKMVDRLLVESEMSAVWYIHKDVRRHLRNMVKESTNTDFLVFMPQGSLASPDHDQLLGLPVEKISQARAAGDEGDISLLDLSYYALVRRKGVEASQSAHVYFMTSEMTFKWTQRIGGQPLIASPITDAYGTTTRSPFIVLAARA